MGINITFTVNLPNKTSVDFDYNPKSGKVSLHDDALLEKMNSVEALKELKSSLDKAKGIVKETGFKADRSTSSDQTAKKIVECIRDVRRDAKAAEVTSALEEKATKFFKLKELETSLNKLEQDVNYRLLEIEMNSVVDNLNSNSELVAEIRHIKQGQMFSGQIGQDLLRFLQQTQFTINFTQARKALSFKDVSWKGSTNKDIGERSKNLIYNLCLAAHGPQFAKQTPLGPLYDKFCQDIDDSKNANDIAGAGEKFFKAILTSKDPKDQMVVRLLYLTISQEIKNNLICLLYCGRKNGGSHTELQLPNMQKQHPLQAINIHIHGSTAQVEREIDIPFEGASFTYHSKMGVTVNTNGKCSNASILESEIKTKDNSSADDIKKATEVTKRIEGLEKKHHVHLLKSDNKVA